MARRVSYEWDIEQWIDGEIVDHDHSESLAGAHADLAALGGTQVEDRLVLVRDEYSDEYTLESRQWAYVLDGQLPEHFENEAGNADAKVPQRFHKALAQEVRS